MDGRPEGAANTRMVLAYCPICMRETEHYHANKMQE